MMRRMWDGDGVGRAGADEAGRIGGPDEAGGEAIGVLVVDDDFRVARVHRAYVDRVDSFRVVGVAAAVSRP